LQCLEVLFRYLVQATDKVSKEDFKRALERMPEGGAVMSTLAEQWFQEGLEKGIKKGLEEGLEKGLERGLEKGLEKGLERGLEKGIKQGLLDGRVSEAHDTIIELIEERFGPVPPGLHRKLSQVRSHELLRTLRRQLRNCRELGDFEQLVANALSGE
jgi:hypothetical protein